MTPAQIAELKAAFEKATPGEWQWDSGDIGNEFPVPYADIYINDGDTIIMHFNDEIPEGKANAKLTTTLHNAFPDLIAHIEHNQRVIAAADRLRAAITAVEADQNEETEQEYIDALDEFDKVKQS